MKSAAIGPPAALTSGTYRTKHKQTSEGRAMAWMIDRSGRTRAARRSKELRERQEQGAKRAELVAEYTQKWGVDRRTVAKHLRKIAGPARNAGTPAVLA